MLGIGIRIAEIRKHYRLNQEEFSEKTGISVSQIKRIEKDVDFLIGHVDKILSAFSGVDKAWLLTGIGSMHSKAAVTHESEEPDEPKSLPGSDPTNAARQAAFAEASLEALTEELLDAERKMMFRTNYDLTMILDSLEELRGEIAELKRLVKESKK